MTENNEELSFNRESALNESMELLKKLKARICTDRFRSYDTDANFLKFCRAYDQHLITMNTLSRDIEIEKLQKEFDEYRKRQMEREH